jgi:hypothetical protein
LAYRLTGAPGTPPIVDWQGTSPYSADELLTRTAPPGRQPRDRAAAFLEEFLSAGPRTSRHIWEAAKKAGLSARTLQRAKASLDIRSRRVGGERLLSYWLLPSQQVPAGGSGLDPELDRIFAELERQFPPRTPLDEEETDEDVIE